MKGNFFHTSDSFLLSNDTCRLTVALLRRNASASSTKSSSLYMETWHMGQILVHLLTQHLSVWFCCLYVCTWSWCQLNMTAVRIKERRICSNIPASTRVCPVKHFVHGGDTVAPHRCDVTTGHNGVVHPRMHCQLLLGAHRKSHAVRRSTALYSCTPEHPLSLWHTLANSVLPVPGGPYIRMFLYRPLFCLVFLVAMAMSRTRSSREGWGMGKGCYFKLWQKQQLFGRLHFMSTHTEDYSLEGVLRFALQPFGHLNDFKGARKTVISTIKPTLCKRQNGLSPH